MLPLPYRPRQCGAPPTHREVSATIIGLHRQLHQLGSNIIEVVSGYEASAATGNQDPIDSLKPAASLCLPQWTVHPHRDWCSVCWQPVAVLGWPTKVHELNAITAQVACSRTFRTPSSAANQYGSLVQAMRTCLFLTSAGGRSNCMGTALAPDDCSTNGDSCCGHIKQPCLRSITDEDAQQSGQISRTSTNLMYDAAM